MTDNTITVAVRPSSLGVVLVGKSTQGVCAILLGDDPDDLMRDLQHRFPDATLETAGPELDGTVSAVVQLVEAPAARSFDVRLDLRGTTFQRRVWQALQEIPAGSTSTTARSPSGSGPRDRRGRWPVPVRLTRSQWRSPATGSFATTAGSPAIAGVSSESAPCSSGRSREPASRDGGRPRPGLGPRRERPGCAGSAVIEALLEPEECRALAAMYDEEERFRTRVVMARHGFGRGEYKYFAYPLPDPIAELRAALYPRLAPVANRWNEAHGHRGALSRRARRLPRALPRGGAEETDAAAAAVRGRATTTACTRISTASTSSRCSSRSCSRSPAGTSPAASS